MFTTLKAAKAGAKRLQSALSKAGYPHKLTHSQAIVAKACGYSNWPHLSKTIGTQHAPKLRTHDEAFATFDAAVRSTASDSNIADLFAAAFRYGASSATSDEIGERLSSLVRQMPGTAIREVHREEVEFDQMNDRKTRRRKIPFPQVPAGEITVDVGLDFETRDLDLPIRFVIAALWSGEEMIGVASGTLLAPKFRCNMTTNDAAEVADTNSAHLVWSVLNLGRDAGDDVFGGGVLFLWQWQLAPEWRGRRLGALFLNEALASLKKSYKTIEAIAIDTSEPGTLDFSGEADATALKAASVRRLRAYLKEFWTNSLGPFGRVLRFDNSRQGGSYQTMLIMGRILNGRGLPEEMPSEDAAMEIHQRAISRIGLFGVKPAKPKPMQADRFPKGYSFHAMVMGGYFKPYEYMVDYLPDEVAEIRLHFAPPDITFRDRRTTRLEELFLRFHNGRSLALPVVHLMSPRIDSAMIADLNRKAPKSELAPKWALGDLHEILATNLRLMFATGSDPDGDVPCGATITIPKDDRPKLVKELAYWPEGIDSHAVLAEIRLRYEATAEDRPARLRSFAAEVLADGFMEGEFHKETVADSQFLRQKFHQTPWATPESTTFGDIAAKLSPTQPYGFCKAYESHGDRLSAFIASLIEPAVADGLSKFPEVMRLLEDLFVDDMKLSRPIEAAPFLPGVWSWWQVTHHALEKRMRATRLAQPGGATSQRVPRR